MQTWKASVPMQPLCHMRSFLAVAIEAGKHHNFNHVALSIPACKAPVLAELRTSGLNSLRTGSASAHKL